MFSFTKTIKFKLTLWYSLLLSFFLLLFSAIVYMGLWMHIGNLYDDLIENSVLIQLDVQGTDLNSSLYIEVPHKLWEKQWQHHVTCLPDKNDAERLQKPLCPDYLAPEVREELESLSLNPVEVIDFSDDKKYKFETLRFLQNFLLFSIPLIILIAFLGGYLIAEHALAPLNYIVRTAREIALGTNLGKRIELKRGAFEFERLAETFDDMMDTIESMFKRHRDFTSEASHELQTPLAIIKTNIDVAMQHNTLKNNAEFKEIAGDINESLQRMSRLVDDMLILSKVDNITEARLKKEKLSLNEYVENETKNLKNLLPTKVKLVVDIAPESSLYVDRSMWDRVFNNLFSNACKYTISGKITISASQTAKYTLFSITDTGEGIQASDQKRIFDRFYRVDKARSRNTGGTGLGLSIVKTIIEAHHGKITLKSKPGEGTSFIIKIPRK